MQSARLPVRRCDAGRPAAAGAGRRALLASASLLLTCAFVLATSVSCAARRGGGAEIETGPDLGIVELRPRAPRSAAADLAFDEAQRLASLGRPSDAVRRILPVLDAEPVFVEGERLLQDLLSGTRSDAWLRQRYRRLGEARPGDPDVLYLTARIDPDRIRQALLFDEALAADPGHPWARLGRAVRLEREGELRAAVREARHVAAEAPWLHLPWLFLGTAALSRGNAEAAVRLLGEAAARGPDDARPWSVLAAAQDDLGDGDRAASAAVEALRRDPGDPGLLWSAGRLFERRGGPAHLRAALAIVDGARGEAGDRAAVDLFRGRVLRVLGEPAQAADALVEALAAGASPGEVAVPLRRARIETGHAAEAVRGYIDALPGDVRDAADGRSAAWRELLAAAVASAPHNAESALRLAGALEAVGWFPEADTVLVAAQEANPDDDRLGARREALRAFGFFLRDLDRLARDVRRGQRRGENASLDIVLRAIGASAQRHLGVDAFQGADVHSYALLGSYLTSADSTGPFHDVFASRGLLLVAGQRSGRGAEILLGRLVSDRVGHRVPVLGEMVECDERWIESDGLPEPLAGLRGGLAGLTLDRCVVIQLDVVRRSVWGDDADLPFLAREARDDDSLRALDTPSDVARRIERALAAGGTTDEQTLDAVLCHERVHVFDAARLLPPLGHPLAVMGLLLDNGFDAASTEQWLEAHAAVGALVTSDEPRAALAALLAFLPATDGDTAHAAGYRAAVEIAVDEILRDPASFPRIDRRWNVVQQMDRLTADETRELGRRILARM